MRRTGQAASAPTPRHPTGQRTSADPHLQVDWTRCRARGLCTEILPDVVSFDPWGYPLLADGGRVPRAQLEAAQQAIAQCPLAALRWRAAG